MDQNKKCLVRMKDPYIIDVSSPSKYKSISQLQGTAECLILTKEKFNGEQEK